jgi:hypothetical protein
VLVVDLLLAERLQLRGCCLGALHGAHVVTALRALPEGRLLSVWKCGRLKKRLKKLSIFEPFSLPRMPGRRSPCEAYGEE